MKQFAVLGTGFARKYRFDIFFRTETTIVLLQTGFILLVIVLIVAEAAFAHFDHYNTLSIGAVIVTVTAILGYVMARLTLAPTRTALIAQKRFVSNIAHEIRTPLSILKTNSEIALLEQSLDIRVQKLFHSNIEEVDRISYTINNLLSMGSFLQSEKINFVDVDLGKTIDNVLAVLTPLARHKHISLTEKKSEYRTVVGNAAAIDQIVANIIKNAIAYTAPGGKIAITVEPNYRGSMDFIVEDTGVGISQKDLDSIFEPFYRTDYSRNRSFGGTGLGLAIVNELVRLHHGKVSVQSILGKGTTVQVSLPCGEPARETKEKSGSKKANEVVFDFT